MAAAPTLDVEQPLLATHRLVAGIDEVGRGALGGPVSVGVAVIDATVAPFPVGLADSKLLTAARREALAPQVRAWAVGHAVGHASAAEIDEHGIVDALRIAALRALAALDMVPDIVILDGSHDWLTREVDLFTAGADVVSTPPVIMKVKADQTCAVVAAASVLAKVERDAIMVQLDAQHPGYGFAGHKGYGSATHREAIATLGPSPVHRVSWRLLG